MDEVWKQVIAFNNAGVHHFVVENFSEALLLFEKSLLSAKANITRMRSNQISSPQSIKDSHQSEDSRIQLVLQELKRCPVSKGCEAPTRPESDESLVAKSCLWISEPSAEGALSVQDWSTFAMSTVYNIAVTYHLIGLRRRSRELLEKADRYYGLAWNLQTQIALRYEVHLSMYLLNNWATLYRSLGHEGTSRQLLQQLYWQISHLGQSGKIQEGARNFDLFLRNLLDLFMKPTQAAGAA